MKTITSLPLPSTSLPRDHNHLGQCLQTHLIQNFASVKLAIFAWKMWHYFKSAILSNFIVDITYSHALHLQNVLCHSTYHQTYSIKALLRPECYLSLPPLLSLPSFPHSTIHATLHYWPVFYAQKWLITNHSQNRLLLVSYPITL